jgi:hypothetical protein
MGWSAAAVALGAYSAHESRKDAKESSRRMEEQIASAELKQTQERDAAVQKAEAARADKQKEMLQRQGRRASILTSARGTEEDDKLGTITRPTATATGLKI